MRPDPPAWLHPYALGPEVDALGQHLAGKYAVLDDLLRAVDVLDEVVERAGALLQTGLGAFPLLRGDDPGNDVERPGTINVLAFGVDGEGHPHHLDRQVGGQLALGQLLGGEVDEVIDQLAGTFPRCAASVNELIVVFMVAVIAPLNGHIFGPGAFMYVCGFKASMPTRKTQASYPKG